MSIISHWRLHIKVLVSLVVLLAAVGCGPSAELSYEMTQTREARSCEVRIGLATVQASCVATAQVLGFPNMCFKIRSDAPTLCPPSPMHTPWIVPTLPPPSPTSTPWPSRATATGDWRQHCIDWRDAARWVGSDTCVCGNVSRTYDADNAFFVNFSEDRSAFYVVSFDHTFADFAGECLCFGGIIETYRNRPEIVVRNASHQIGTCGGLAVSQCGTTADQPCWQYR